MHFDVECALAKKVIVKYQTDLVALTTAVQNALTKKVETSGKELEDSKATSDALAKLVTDGYTTVIDDIVGLVDVSQKQAVAIAAALGLSGDASKPFTDLFKPASSDTAAWNTLVGVSKSRTSKK